jgi:hypothetical protein
MAKIELVNMSPGTGITLDAQSDANDSAIITGYVEDVASLDSLTSTGSIMPNSVNSGGGFPIPKVSESRQLMDGCKAKIVARYNRKRPQYLPELQIDSTVEAVRLFTDADGNLLPRNVETGELGTRILYIPVENISWYHRAYSKSSAYGSWNNTYNGKANQSSYSISGTSYAANTLRFNGFKLRHYTGGGFNIFDMRFDFTFRPDGWLYQDVDANDVVSVLPSYAMINFPSLP